jgi:hypothetical protein
LHSAVDGLGGLVDRPHRPHGHPAQMPAVVEAAVGELRRVHPGVAAVLTELWTQDSGTSR